MRKIKVEKRDGSDNFWKSWWFPKECPCLKIHHSWHKNSCMTSWQQSKSGVSVIICSCAKSFLSNTDGFTHVMCNHIDDGCADHTGDFPKKKEREKDE